MHPSSTVRRSVVFGLLVLSFGCTDAADPFAATSLPRALTARVEEPTILSGFFREPRGNDVQCVPQNASHVLSGGVTAAAWVDETGGSVSITGSDHRDLPIAHTLIVPAGVVAQNTLFCMRLDPSNHMKVELTAYAVAVDGSAVNVGRRGFDSPVYLDMAYSGTSLTERHERMTIVYEPEIGPLELVHSTSWGEARTSALGELWHFSKYALALD